MKTIAVKRVVQLKQRAQIKRVVQIFCAIIILVSATARADMTFKIATIAPDGTRWMTMMRAAAKDIKLQTDGRVKFKFYPGGVMGGDSSVMRKIRIGQLHGGAFTGGGLSEAYPDMVIYGLPMLFANFEEVDHVRARMDKVFEAGMEDAGLVNFGMVEGGFAMFMGSNAIRNTANLQDEKSWVPEGDAIAYAAYKALGVSPVVLPITDVLTGMQTGLVSTVLASPLAAVALQWHTRIKYVTDVPMSYVMGILAIDKRAFSRISASDQILVRSVLTATFDQMNAFSRADDGAARAALVNQGITFLRPADNVVEEWRKVSRQVIDQKGKEGAFDLNLANEVARLIENYRRQEKAHQGE
jgi:TRAP-type C4-dicarboxylate transport system substrate-binding protein